MVDNFTNELFQVAINELAVNTNETIFVVKSRRGAANVPPLYLPAGG